MSSAPSIRNVLFYSAACLPTPEERKVFLDYVCRDDEGLKEHLGKLLALESLAAPLFDLRPEKTDGSTAFKEESNGTRIGRYRLIERAGEGGCGVVYLAEQQEPVRRKVALKIIRPGMDTENVVARFEAERQSLALMDHPNIARVFDAGSTESGRPYFVMELVDGERITDFCQDAGFDLRQRLALFVQVCRAIQHAHQKGVIHRDIKPSNVLVRRHDGVPVPKVIDFGIAKAATGGPGENATFTTFDQFLGTPAYMSPEQASGGVDVDTRSDIYSLGAMLYELIAGRPAFDSKRLKETSIEETRRILREEEPPAPSIVAGGRKVCDLDWIVMKAMAKERTRRYDTAIGLATEVLRYLNDEPVSARPPSRRYRLGKLVKRNKGIFAAVGIAVFGLWGGLGTATWLFLREKSAREEQTRLHQVADQAREKAEFRERVAQAAVQLGRSNLREADRLLGTIPIDRVPTSLEAADCYRKAAEWHVLGGRFDHAAERYSSAAYAFSNVDDADSDTISIDVLAAATSLCHVGDFAAYDRIRTFAIQRFSGTRHPQVAEQVLKASLLRPASESQLRQLDEIKEIIESALNDGTGWTARNSRFAAWCCFAIGLKQFRDGNDDHAVHWLNRCFAYPDAYEPRIASVRFILAMIECRKNNPAEARKLIESSREPVEQALRDRLSLGGQDEAIWLDWVDAKLLLDQAMACLNDPQPAAEPTANDLQ
jgi:serine/threonine protein kinase